MNAAAIAATAINGKNMKNSFVGGGIAGTTEKMTKAPMTKTAKGASRGLRRFQFIEPIASTKTLVIGGAKEI